MGIILERFGRKITVRRCNIVWRQILSPPRTCWRFRSRPQTEQSTKDCLNCPVRGAFNIVSGIGYWSSTPLWNSAFLRSLFDQVSRISPRFFYERGMVKRLVNMSRVTVWTARSVVFGKVSLLHIRSCSRFLWMIIFLSKCFFFRNSTSRGPNSS
jgi:hypothetical protein